MLVLLIDMSIQLNRGSGGPAGRFWVGVVFEGAADVVGGVTDEDIAIWLISSTPMGPADVLAPLGAGAATTKK